jgi:hypothetical protein
MEKTMPNRLRLLAAFLPLIAGAAAAGPDYTANGELVPPADYREWVYLSTGLDMSYREGGTGMDHSMFDNVFVDPAAWASFKQTGHWPDKTILVLETRVAADHGSIEKTGHFQTEDVMGVEVHVRDEARFKGGWGFFALDGKTPAKQIPYTAECYACHQKNGAVDTTFAQFYPPAKPIAVKAGTFRETP